MLSRIEAKLVRFSQAVFYFLVAGFHIMLFLPLLRIKVEGRENILKKGRFIVAANHQNFYDGFIIAYVIGLLKKVSFVIARRALKNRFNEILAWLIGSVIIGNDAEEYQRALKKLNRILSHGGAVGIFPEGDISNKKNPRKFKGGVAKLSIDSQTKVIPVYLGGTYNLRYLSHWLRRPTVLVRIGKPLELYNYVKDFGNNLDEIASVLREKIIELGDLSEIERNNNLDSNKLKSFTAHPPIPTEIIIEAQESLVN